MAGSVPLRHVLPSSMLSHQQPQPLQMLLQMGFTQKRAQKALAATGGRSVQLASDWLAARLNDPKLDDSAQREYVLYVRPGGPLCVQIYDFWHEVLGSAGRNAAQNLMPHITLCSYFKVGDEHSGQLCSLLYAAAASVLAATPLPLPLSLEKYASHNYVGLFVTPPSAHVLQEVKRTFIQSASSICPSLSTASNTTEDLHLTLAYSFPAAQFHKLEQLVEAVDVTAPSTWELCLYSREPRFNGLELYKSERGHNPKAADELLLMHGDYVYVNSEDTAASVGAGGKPKEWVQGTSWLTGCSGLVPMAYLNRVPESDTWTLHRGLTINSDGTSLEVTDGICAEESVFGVSNTEDVGNKNNSGYSSAYTSGRRDSGEGAGGGAGRGSGDYDGRGEGGVVISDVYRSGLSSSLLNLLDHSEGSRRSTTAHSDASSSDRLQHHSRQVSQDGAYGGFVPPPPGHRSTSLTHDQIDQLYAKVNKTVRKPPLYHFPITGPRKLFVMRHGERADFTFGDWTKACFDKDDVYTRADLNLQGSLPSRADAPHTFIKDCPLTRIGELQARLVGEGFVATNTLIHHVFCSPSLRCVMTAANVLQAMGIADRLPLKLEPGLFEWLAWYPEGIPRFMTLEELVAAGYNIDMNYRPVLPVSRMPSEETCEQYYNRNGHVTNALIASTNQQGGTMLLVAHAASLDTCVKQLVGGHPRTSSNIRSLIKKVAYCAISAVEKDEAEGLWNLIEPPFRSPTHSSNQAYDWNIWQQQQL